MINSLAVIGNASVDISSLTVLESSLWSNERGGSLFLLFVFLCGFLCEFLVVVGVVKLLIGFFDVPNNCASFVSWFYDIFYYDHSCVG